jgi:hypothetical protein
MTINIDIQTLRRDLEAIEQRMSEGVGDAEKRLGNSAVSQAFALIEEVDARLRKLLYLVNPDVHLR